ncbi:guanine deaminase [Planococcus sp. PAMC 21323]|uniref:guanine deaminase n=1 Tax=Planococcus sp. PAMC 21323 TaxID=1526927 RepID=UPI000571D3AA|nr:guanine deaminase [Planococcus sp. PAMC 21323]AIY05654.1 guanine deaminase [Planococcus sp. PAMC 21323]
MIKVIKGTAFSSLTKQDVEILENHLFCINDEGFIARRISPNEADYETVIRQAQKNANFLELTQGQYLLPGFVDLHIHAPQWAQTGTALDLPLYEWLNTYTFPLEAKFSDISFAKKTYSHLVDTLLANGTTTALYFATIHEEASYLLAEICAKKGQRGLVGKVVMDEPSQNPEFYRDQSLDEALAGTERFIKRVQLLNNTTKQGVYPVVTPRFVPSCTTEALSGLGKIAAQYDVHITSHCSESDWAHDHVKERFGINDAQVLDGFGLLTEKAIMAHSNFLSDDDAETYLRQGTAIAHCPISNAYFANSVIPIKHFSEMGVEIALGTDLSAGYDPSIYSAIRQAVISSRMLEDGVDTSKQASERGRANSRITVNEAFYFATAGGGESISLPVGRLAETYAFDAQIIDTQITDASMPIFDGFNSLEDIFQKILYMTQRHNIVAVFVQGEQLK